MNQNYANQESGHHRKIPVLTGILFFFLLVLTSGQLSAQYSIQGKVLNPGGETLPGATVQIKQLNKSLATDNQVSLKLRPDRCQMSPGSYLCRVQEVSIATKSKSGN